MDVRKRARVILAAGVTGIGLVLGTATVAAQTPITAVSDTASVAEDTSITINVLANDLPSSGLTLSGVTNPPNGTATISANQVVYTPDANFHGTDTFAYTVTDGANTVGAAVTVHVLPVNDAPVAVPDSISTKAGAAKVFSVLSNDTDVDGDTLSVDVQSQPAHGTLALDAATQKLTYTPAAGYTGADSFTYRASDGTLTSNTVTVSIEVKTAASKPVGGLDSRIVALCGANSADERLQGLCGVYLRVDMPPWARANIGQVILRLVAKRAPDAVAEACRDAGSEHVEWLCEIYEARQLPPGIKKQIGQRILALDGTAAIAIRQDVRSEWKPGRPAWLDELRDRDKDRDRDRDGNRDKDKDRDRDRGSQSQVRVSSGDDDDRDGRRDDGKKPGRKGWKQGR